MVNTMDLYKTMTSKKTAQIKVNYMTHPTQLWQTVYKSTTLALRIHQTYKRDLKSIYQNTYISMEIVYYSIHKLKNRK